MNRWSTQNISTPSYGTVVTSGLSSSVWLWSIRFSSGALNTTQSPGKQCKPFRGEVLNHFPQVHSFMSCLKRRKEAGIFHECSQKKKCFFMMLSMANKKNYLSLCVRTCKNKQVWVPYQKYNSVYLPQFSWAPIMFGVLPLPRRHYKDQDRLYSELKSISLDSSWSNVSQHAPRTNSKS